MGSLIIFGMSGMLFVVGLAGLAPVNFWLWEVMAMFAFTCVAAWASRRYFAWVDAAARIGIAGTMFFMAMFWLMASCAWLARIYVAA